MTLDREALEFRGTRRQWYAVGLIVLGPVFLIGVLGVVLYLLGDVVGPTGAVAGIFQAVAVVAFLEVGALYIWLGSDGKITFARAHADVPWILALAAFVAPLLEHWLLRALVAGLAGVSWYLVRWWLTHRASSGPPSKTMSN